MSQQDINSDGAFLEHLFRDGVNRLSPADLQRLGALGKTTFRGMPLVIYYLKNAGWQFKDVMNAFNDNLVDWNVRDEDGNTCLHLAIALHGQRSDWSTRSVVIMMMRNGADLMLKNHLNQSTIEFAIADSAPDAVIHAMVQVAPKEVLNEMNILNIILSSANTELPLTLGYLVGHQQIVITCDHLITFIDLPLTPQSYVVTNQMIAKLSASEDSLAEIRCRRPHLLIDVARMVTVTQSNHEKVITKLQKLLKMDINYWSDDSGSVLYHLLAGHRNLTHFDHNLNYICTLLTTADPNQTYKGTPLIICYLKSPAIDWSVLNMFAVVSTNWNVIDELGKCPFYYIIKAGQAIEGSLGSKFVPNQEILNDNQMWDGNPVVEFLLDSSSHAIKRPLSLYLVNLVQELLIRGANRSLPSTVARLIELRESTPELIALAISRFDFQTSVEELNLAIGLGRADLVLTILENADQEMISILKFLIPNVINNILKIAIKLPLKTDLLMTIKVLIEKFKVDVNCAMDADGFVIHNLVLFDDSGKQEVLDYVLNLEELEVNKKLNGMSGLDFAISKLNYEAAAKLIEHFADYSHWQSMLIKKCGFTRFVKLLCLDRPSLSIQFEATISKSTEFRQLKNWNAEQKRTVRSLYELCALAIRRRTRTKSELKNLIRDIEFPGETKDVLFLRKFVSSEVQRSGSTSSPPVHGRISVKETYWI